MSQVDDVWYRYEDIQYAPPVDEWGDACGEGRIVVELREFRVIRITAKGVRLSCDRVVLDRSQKKFACPTKELAKESFIRRKSRQASILHHQLNRVEVALFLINNRE